MTVEVLYVHDDKRPMTWTGRTIHPAIIPVTAEGRDLEQVRRRVREGLDASGFHGAKLVEYQGVLIT